MRFLAVAGVVFLLSGCVGEPAGAPVVVYVQNGWHRDAVVHMVLDGENATVRFDVLEDGAQIPNVERALETRVRGASFKVWANESLSGVSAAESFRVTGENHVREPGFD